MIEKDALQRFIFDTAPVRGELVHLDESYKTIIEQHPYPEPIRQLLGQALSVAALLTAVIKFSGRLTVQFRGKGNLKLLLAQSDNHFNLRGLVKWEGDLSYADLMESFNEGVLVIMLDSGTTKRTSYQGIVPWRGNSFVESIEGYFMDSEQLATRIWLSVSDHAAAGLLLQVLPGNEKNMQGLEKEIMNVHWERLSAMTSSLNQHDLLNLDHENLLRKIYQGEQIRLFPSAPIAFKCTCSRRRGEEAIAIMGEEEANDELKTHHVIVVTCDFCNKEYTFDKVDVAKIFAGKDLPPTDTHIH